MVDLPAGSAIGPWEEAGATWILTDFRLQPREREVREAIETGPHRVVGASNGSAERLDD